MTFYEAAIEVLRRSGRPLHFKKITEIAIRDGLLDHVGKTPDVTMSARLNQEVKREEQAAILRTRPGVFTLRDDVAKKLNEEAAAREAEQAASNAEEAARQAEEANKRAEEAARKEAARAEALAEAHRLLAAQQQTPQAAPAARPAPTKPVAAPAAQEEDEGEGEEEEGEEESSAEGAEPGEGGRRRRRRRRGRRGRGGEAQNGAEGGEEAEEVARVASAAQVEAALTVAAPAAPVAPAAVAAAPPVIAEAPAPIVRGREERERRDRRRDREGRRDREEGSVPREERNGHAPALREEIVATPAPARQEAAPAPARQDSAPRAEAAKLDGFAQAAYTVLRERRAPLTLSALSDAIQERKLVRFHTHDAVATLRAALVNDNHIRSQRRARPLFASYEQGRWGLTDWGLSDGNLRREQQISALSEECEQDTLRALGEALVGVSNEALEQLVLQLLDRMGYRNIKVSKRSANGDVFFTADVRQGFRETRVCVQITGERAPLAQSAVVELRSTLHHYSASEGVILHLGDATREAIEESREARLAPVAVIDRAQLVRALLTHEIGVKRVWAPLVMVDTAFVDALKGAQGA